MVTLTPFLMDQLEKEHGFVISEIKRGVASGGGTFNIHIRNPSDSDYTLMIPIVNPTTKGETTFKVYDDFDSITDGTQVVVQNATLDSAGGAPDMGPMEVFRDSSFTEASGAEHAGGVVGSGGGGTNALGGGMVFPPMRIESGREIVLELTNDDGGTAYDMNILVFVLI